MPEHLVCAQCRFPLVAADEVIAEQFASLRAESVYSYELDVLQIDTWCYSATNAHDHRFDVVRALPSSADATTYHGEPVAEHSWFPGFSWSMCHCSACDSHLGWGFSTDGACGGSSATADEEDNATAAAAHEAEEDTAGGGGRTSYTGLAFRGLVLTKMASEECPDEPTLAAQREVLAAMLAHRLQFRDDEREIRALLNAVPVAAAQPFVGVLLQFRAEPSSQLQSAEALAAVRAALSGGGGVASLLQRRIAGWLGFPGEPAALAGENVVGTAEDDSRPSGAERAGGGEGDGEVNEEPD